MYFHKEIKVGERIMDRVTVIVKVVKLISKEKISVLYDPLIKCDDAISLEGVGFLVGQLTICSVIM